MRLFLTPLSGSFPAAVLLLATIAPTPAACITATVSASASLPEEPRVRPDSPPSSQQPSSQQLASRAASAGGRGSVAQNAEGQRAPAATDGPTAQRAGKRRSDAAPALDVTVLDGRGAPVAGALVIAAGTGGVPPVQRSARTDEKGRASLDGLPRPPWDLAVQARGFAPRRLSRVAAWRPLQVRLEPGRVLSGVVRDSVSRRPVASARVWVRTNVLGVPANRWDPEADRISTKTDARGRFVLEGLPASPTTVEAAAAGYGRGERRSVRPGEPLELFLLPGAALAGAVHDDAGHPVAGAIVRILADVASRVTPPAERTDASGRFDFAGLENGTYTVAAREGARAPAIVPVSIDEAQDARVELTLVEGGFATGRLVDTAGRPLRGRVRLAALDGRSMHPALYDLVQAEAAADGRFVLGPAPLGAVELEAFSPGLATRTVEASLHPRALTADLGDIVLETGLRVRGLVRRTDGSPVAGATLTTYSQSSPSERPLTAVSEDDGTFALAGLQPGNVRLQASAPGQARTTQIVAAGSENVVLVLDAAGEITGSVVDESGQPADGAFVSAQFDGEGERLFGGANANEGEGRFTIRDLRAGRYVLQARAAGHGNATASGVVVAGRSTDVGLLQLRRGAAIRGTVVDSAGDPVAAASVRTRSGPRPSDGAQTDGNGSFEIAGVAPGRFDLEARHPAFAPANAVVEVRGETETVDVRLVLARGGRIEGTVVRRDGQPYSRARLMVAPQGRSSFSPEGSEATARDDGSFAIDNVPAGRVRLHVMAPASGVSRAFDTLLARELDVAEGETTKVELATRDVLVTGRVTRGDDPAPGIVLGMQSMNGGSFDSSRCRSGATASPQPLCAVTREDGSYELIVFEPGRYLPLRIGPGGSTGPLRLAQADPTRPFSELQIPDALTYGVDFAIGRATVTGVIVDGATERPIAGARVLLTGRGSSGNAETTADGRFELESEPGEARLMAFAPEYVNHEQAITVPDSALPALRLELRKGRTITGRVEDGSGRPRGDVPVRAELAESSTRRSGPQGFTMSLPDGRFRIAGLKDGAHTLFAGLDSVGFATLADVQAGANDVVMTLRAPARLVVRVLDKAAQAVPNAHVRVAQPNGGSGVGVAPTEVTNAQGRAELAVPEGSWEVMVIAPPRLVGRGSVEVVSGGSVAVDITVDEPKPPRR